MRKLLFFILVSMLSFCTSSTTAKKSFVLNATKFIEATKADINNKVKINLKSKLDSLADIKSKLATYSLDSLEKKKIEEGVLWLESNLQSEASSVDSRNNGNVNFYFENSASMFGYLEQKNFQQTVNRIFLNIDRDKLSATSFVNNKEYPQDNILEKINNAKVRVGDITSSDHRFIFENAIKKAANNNLSIVITDGIYSVKKGNLNLVSIEIESAFKNALKVSEIESVILKMSSNFKGKYFSSTCASEGGKKINQERPYYVIMFGNANRINNALDEIVIIEDLPGYKEQARFSLTKNLNPSYTILTTGEEKHGEFKPTVRGTDIIQDISEAAKYKGIGSNDDRYLQFAIAIDLSDVSVPEQYLKDLKNYTVSEELGYSIESIIAIDELSKASDTYKKVQKVNESNNLALSHLIVVKSATKLYGALEISLNNNLPSWIQETGDDDDCDIKGDTEHTFAFDELIIGISRAYDKVNKKKEILKIKVNIKA
jgi:hypothetical protein